MREAQTAKKTTNLYELTACFPIYGRVLNGF